MLYKSLAVAALAPLATAFPFVMELDSMLDRRATFPQDTSNCGSQPCLTFNAADQFVDTSNGGKNPFIKPGSGDIRGLCPGLNAAANHGFLPRNGLATTAQTIAGLGSAYNMGADLAGFLAIVAIALTGDPATGTWSIGGTFPVNSADGLLSQPGGISNSHNKYEGDASVVRGDAYLNGGKATVFKMNKFQHMYGLTKTNYGFPVLREHNKWSHDLSVSTNPYYFSAPFSGLVAPAAYQFVVNFMSNHSAAAPEGTLTPAVLKSFFAVSGPDNALVYNAGQERIPYPWYRRPTSDQHTIPKVFLDLLYTASKYPDLIQVGGNTGKVNSFAGVDLGNLTGGVYTSQNILQGNNLGCFFFQAFEAALPDELAGVVGDVATVVSMVDNVVNPIIANLKCPTLSQYNQGLFNKFPGYTYHPGNTS